jgi:mono/diheme cytochrome c family protein
MSKAGRLFHRRLAAAVAALVAAGAAAAATMVALHVPDPPISPALVARQPDVAHGAYVARLGDCAACHTADEGKPFAGGIPFPTPFGAVYSSNITPDGDTGIGRYGFKEFVRVLRFGVAPDGTRLYPAMPYTAYAKVSDEDLQDLFAYLQHGVAPQHQATRRDGIAWPFSIRWPLAFWDLAFHDDRRFVADPAKSERWNRGAHLVEGLGHCGTCHTPRGFALQEVALTGKDGSAYLSGGGIVNGWVSPSLRNEHGGGLADWSQSDIVWLLRTGRNVHSATFGGMSDVVVHSTQHASDEDLASIAVFLKSLPPNNAATAYVYDATASKALRDGDAQTRGAQIYVDRCAGCHRTDGRGYARVFPSLAGNPLLQTGDPASVIRIVLSGSTLPATESAPSAFTMGGYAGILTDQDIADVATFIQTSWGNRGAPVTDANVAALRKRAN